MRCRLQSERWAGGSGGSELRLGANHVRLGVWRTPQRLGLRPLCQLGVSWWWHQGRRRIGPYSLERTPSSPHLSPIKCSLSETMAGGVPYLLGQTFSSVFGRAGFNLCPQLRHLLFVVVPMFTRPHVSGEGAGLVPPSPARSYAGISILHRTLEEPARSMSG